MFLVALAFGLVTAFGFGSLVAADPIGDKQAQATAIQDQIDANNRQLGVLAEQYNGAQLKLQSATQALLQAQAGIDAAQRQVDELKVLVAHRAAAAYRQAVLGDTTNEFNTKSLNQLATSQKYAASQTARDNTLLTQLDATKAELTKQRQDAQAAQAAANSQREQLATTKASLEAVTAQQQQILSQVQGELAQLVAQEQQRRQTALLAAAATRFGSGTGNPGDYPNLPPVSPAAANAIAFARTQLGKPYVYAAAGPDAYDCSGLVMASFAAASVSLPHYSGAQYDLLPRVSLDAVQPGDLLFWGPGGSEHVAIYVGAGRILESGGTGNGVHIGPIWGSPSGAARVV